MPILYSSFGQLIQDDTPMVRRAAAKALGVSRSIVGRSWSAYCCVPS